MSRATSPLVSRLKKKIKADGNLNGKPSPTAKTKPLANQEPAAGVHVILPDHFSPADCGVSNERTKE